MMTMEYNHDLELQATKEEGFEEGIDNIPTGGTSFGDGGCGEWSYLY